MATGKLLKKFIVHPLEWIGFKALTGFFRILPLEVASSLGGRLLRFIGPMLKADRVARRNLIRAFPDLPQADVDRIVKGMWDNLGRVVGEWIHVPDMRTEGPDREIEIEGGENVLKVSRNSGAIVFSAHLGNWETISLVGSRLGLKVSAIYRAAGNPLIDADIRRMRLSFVDDLMPKGAEGAKGAIRALKGGKTVGMLIDQKLNTGEPIPFFGRDAMTTPAPVELAMRLKVPLVPARIERIGGAKMKVTIFPPLEIPDTGDRQADIRAVLKDMNALLEQWIRERPEQWFWVHKRWPD